MTLFWIIVAIVVIGIVVWYFMAGKKKGPTLPRRPEGPTVPPPPPPETPGV
jgi:hypothetical protein